MTLEKEQEEEDEDSEEEEVCVQVKLPPGRKCGVQPVKRSTEPEKQDLKTTAPKAPIVLFVFVSQYLTFVC